jgi:PhnB protein
LPHWLDASDPRLCKLYQSSRINQLLKEFVMQVNAYLNFDGRCEEAINFYTKAVDAKLEMLMRFKESPEPPPPGSPVPSGEKIMHSCFSVGGTRLMASDGYCTSKPSFQGISLSLSAADEAEAKRVFDALSEGGEVRMPLTKTFFSPAFGMLADRFGVTWMVVVPAPM